MSIAFFDLDRTLIARNSGAMWVRQEWREGRISRLQALEAAFWLLRYHLGQGALEDALHRSIATLRGDLEAELRQRTLEFYARDVAGLMRPGALAAVEHHRRAGDRLVVLTSSSSYMAEAAREQLGFEGALANVFEVDAEGRYTGLARRPLCYGLGKVTHATRYAEDHGVPLEDCVFYTDSASDLPMMEAVGQPVAVHPDRRLRRIAETRGWPIEDWGEPLSGGAAGR